MSLHSNTSTTPGPAGVICTLLPGPDRKRSARSYSYRVTYRNPDRDAAGCVLLWHVAGGRMGYQIALERDDNGNLQLHCTCADAVFRAEPENRFCKHVRGLLEFNRGDSSSERQVGVGA
jgi:hypothetical protein